MKSKSPSIRVIRAAIERHNKWVSQQVAEVEHSIQVDMQQHSKAHLNKIIGLLGTIDVLRKEMNAAGWDVTFDGFYHGDRKLTATASLKSERVQKLIRERQIKLPTRLTENELLLALAATEEESVARALDKLNVHWRGK